MVHKIKLQKEFCEAVESGIKPFEIRYNDRGYQRGDIVRFIPVDNQGKEIFDPISQNIYEITYVISGWGLKEDYVCFGIRYFGESNDSRV